MCCGLAATVLPLTLGCHSEPVLFPADPSQRPSPAKIRSRIFRWGIPPHIHTPRLLSVNINGPFSQIQLALESSLCALPVEEADLVHILVATPPPQICLCLSAPTLIVDLFQWHRCKATPAFHDMGRASSSGSHIPNVTVETDTDVRKAIPTTGLHGLNTGDMETVIFPMLDLYEYRSVSF